MSKHVDPSIVSRLKILQAVRRIKDEELAEAAGTCRSYINLMMNHRVPFQTKYLKPIEDLLTNTENMS